jgi:hypothetical protein
LEGPTRLVGKQFLFCFLAIAPAALLACYESATRRGPLAVLVDSLVGVNATLKCLSPPRDEQLPNYPHYHICASDSNPTVFFYVGANGAVLSVTRNLRSDSTGLAALAELRSGLNRRFGAPRSIVDDSDERLSSYWSGDSVCVSLHRRITPPRLQLGYRTLAFARHCP